MCPAVKQRSGFEKDYYETVSSGAFFLRLIYLRASVLMMAMLHYAIFETSQGLHSGKWEIEGRRKASP